MARNVHSPPLTSTHSGCTCGESDAAATPVLDARTIPHDIRHAAIFGALDSLNRGSVLVLVPPHDPKPLLAHARERYVDGIDVTDLETCPEAWRIQLRTT